jgi:hypothetical protein
MKNQSQPCEEERRGSCRTSGGAEARLVSRLDGVGKFQYVAGFLHFATADRQPIAYAVRQCGPSCGICPFAALSGQLRHADRLAGQKAVQHIWAEINFVRPYDRPSFGINLDLAEENYIL